ncbi:MAG TPA: ATP-binding protein [Pseudohongiella sp.]|nr:ATP-binding protein [Pseudohongiella sp.]
MKQVLALIAVLGMSLGLSANAHADIFAVFRYEDGRTNWQYIANTSASLLIIVLSIVLFFLVKAHIRARRSNKALTEIKATLEQRVEQRTAVLQETAEQLRKRENYIASIVDSMPVMLVGLNQQLQVTQWNHLAETTTGRPFADVAGMDLWKAYPAITLTEEQVRHVLSTGETLNLKHTQRGQYSFDITIYRLEHDDDTGIVILISDITKQVKAENKVAERDKLSALGELASAMAYDISLPINTIFQRVSDARQRIEAVDLGPMKDQLLQEVEVVRQSAQQAKAISENLLALSASHQREPEQADVTRIMENSIAAATELFNDVDGLAFRDVTVRRRYEDDLPAVKCIPDELEQVFVRLLRSAFYALKDSGADAVEPVITVDISNFMDTLWIKVSHKGRGLSDEEQLEIFEPYFSMSASTATCPVERRLSYPYFIITEHHRGLMSVTSDEQSGTTFNIQLTQV